MKTFRTVGSGSTQTIEPIENNKIPVYETKTAAETDLANLEVGQIIATNDKGSELSNPVDVVQDGNMHAVTSNAVADGLNEVMPAGTILPGMWATAPKGFLLCDGATYQTSQYPVLAAVLGATGETFTVPNLVDRFLQGANANVGTYKDAGLPNITGSIGVVVGEGDIANGAFYNNGDAGRSRTDGASITNERFTATKVFDASRSSSIYGKSSTVQPASFTVNYIIKY